MTRINGLIIAGLGLASSVLASALDRSGPNRPANNPANHDAPNKPSKQHPDPPRPIATSPHGQAESPKPYRPVPANPGAGKSAGSPDYPWLFEYPLPIPEVAQPLFTETVNGIPIQYYETTIEPFQQQVYPNLGPANLIGYGENSFDQLHQHN